MKSFRPRDEPDRPDGDDRSRNSTVDFRAEKGSNAPHASTTDPDAMLYRRTRAWRPGFASSATTSRRAGRACWSMPASRVSGHAERLAALKTIERHADRPCAITLGAERGYDTADFVLKQMRKEGRQRELSASARVSYDKEARTAKDQARIRVMGEGDTAGLRVSAINSEGRDGSERLVADQPVFTVQLRRGENRVRVMVTDETGARVEGAGADLVVKRVAAVAAGAPCTNAITIQVVEYQGDRARNGLMLLINKDATLPDRGMLRLRAAKRLVAGGSDWIDFELYEKESGLPDPEPNHPVGSFRMTASALPLGQTVYEGDEVDHRWSVDESQLLHCSAELPRQAAHLDDRDFHVDDLASR